MISVIIPVYNTKDYLDECIGSVVNQTYRDLEIILVDDCSTDGSGELLDKWAAKDDRIVVIHKEKNSGVSDTRNIGLKASRGEFIAFVDSDDWIDPDMYEKLIDDITSTGADMAISGYVKHIAGGTDQILIPKYDQGKLYSVETALEHCSPKIGEGKANRYNIDKLYRRACLIKDERLILYNVNYSFCEDVLWLTEVILNCTSFCFCGIAAYHYRYSRSGNANSEMNVGLSVKKIKSAVETNHLSRVMLENAEINAANGALRYEIGYRQSALMAAVKTHNTEMFDEYKKGFIRDSFQYAVRSGTLNGYLWLAKKLAVYGKLRLKKAFI